MDFKIINMRKVNSEQAPKLAARFDLETDDLLIRGCKLLRADTGLWVAMPSTKIQERKREVFEGVVQVKDAALFNEINRMAQDAYFGKR